MKIKYPSFSRLLTPILIVAILLFAAMVSFATISAYNREQTNIENYTHVRMKTLILDLETKLVSVESVLTTENHRHRVEIGDSTQIFTRLEQIVNDQKAIRHAGLDIWNEEMPDSLSYVYYVSRLRNGENVRMVRRENVNDIKEEKEFYTKAIETGEPVWTHPYEDDNYAHATVVTCYLKVEDNMAMFFVDVEMNSLLKTIDSLQFYEGSRMYITAPHEGTFTRGEDGVLETVDKIEYDRRHYTAITAHYRRLNIDIVNIVPNDQIYITLWRNVVIVLVIFVLGLVFLAVLVHRTFTRAQDDLAESIEKSNARKNALDKIENEVAIASRIQNKMLTDPGRPAHYAPEGACAADLMAHMLPAREVGGDLYEYRTEGDNVVVCIGDVSGKGIPASMVMAMCSTLFNAYVSDNADPDPAELLGYLNKHMCRRNDDVMFVTLWTGVLNLRTGTLKYGSAGHNPPVLVRGGSAEFLEMRQGIPLGMFEDSTYENLECRMEEGDSLLMYTDGITEAEGPGKVLFGDDRLLQSCRNAVSTCPGVLCRFVLNDVTAHAAGCSQSDDITLLCVSFGGKYAQLNGISDVPALHTLVAECGESDNAALVLEEATANAFTHGKAGMVDVGYREGVFTMITDGDDFDPTKYKVPEKADGELSIGGRGIPLIRELCSQTTYRRLDNGLDIQTFKPKEI